MEKQSNILSVELVVGATGSCGSRTVQIPAEWMFGACPCQAVEAMKLVFAKITRIDIPVAPAAN